MACSDCHNPHSSTGPKLLIRIRSTRPATPAIRWMGKRDIMFLREALCRKQLMKQPRPVGAAESLTIALGLCHCRMKDSTGYRNAVQSAVVRTRNLLRREQIDAIERGDDLTANEQLLQIVTIAKLFVVEDAAPKIRGGNLGLAWLDEASRNEHANFSSTARATPHFAAFRHPQSEIRNLKWGGRRDSNPQQPESQSGALPLSYGHHRVRT